MNSCFSQRFGDRSDSTMVRVAVAIESYGLDPQPLGTLREELAHLDSPCFAPAGSRQLRAEFWRQRRRARKSMSVGIVDDLAVDVAQATRNRDSGSLAGPLQLAANVHLPPRSPGVLDSISIHLLGFPNDDDKQCRPLSSYTTNSFDLLN